MRNRSRPSSWHSFLLSATRPRGSTGRSFRRAPDDRVRLRHQSLRTYDYSPNRPTKGMRSVTYRGLKSAGIAGVVVSGLLLSGCAQTPLGPTVQVMPGPGKSFETFTYEQA